MAAGAGGSASAASASAAGSASAASASASKWSEIQLELMGSFLIRLAVTDHLRFAAVCTAWRSAVRSRIFAPVPQAPWLMLPNATTTTTSTDETNRQESRVATFYSLSEWRLYRINLPDPPIADRLCIGSSEGWLITADETSELHLLNPVTRAQIPLPSVSSLPHIKAIHAGARRRRRLDHYQIQRWIGDRSAPDSFGPEYLRFRLFTKAVLAWTSPVASRPSSSSSSSAICRHYTVVLTYCDGRMLAFAGPGDQKWTVMKPDCSISDVIHHNGKFYTVDGVGAVRSWDAVDARIKMKLIVSALTIHHPCKCYLVESSAGDLLLVIRKRHMVIPDMDLGEYRTIKFKVLKLTSGGEPKLIKMKSLDDDALFLGCNRSMAFSAREFPDLRRNCIYFTDDTFESFRYGRNQYRDMGVFSLEDGRIDPFSAHDSSLTWPSPIWLTPSLF